MKSLRPMLVLAAACVFVLASGCGDDEPTRLNPGSSPTISNIWPNDDGRAWSYSYVQRIWDSGFPSRLYATPDEVPPVPTLTEIASILGSQPIGEVYSINDLIYGLQFSGYITTPPGVTAQNLQESLLPIIEVSSSSIAQVVPEDALLSRLMLARPDLRDKIAAYVNSRSVPGLSELRGAGLQHAPRSGITAGGGTSMLAALALQGTAPVLLHGGAWKKSERWIGTYGDVDTLLAYMYLKAPLLPGREFTFQLVPSLADDVFEHCRILRTVRVQTEAGVFNNAIECLYVIDYGILTLLGPKATQYSRAFDYGTVVYVPDVGPVHCYERTLVEPGDPLTIGVGDITLSLMSTGISVN